MFINYSCNLNIIYIGIKSVGYTNKQRSVQLYLTDQLVDLADWLIWLGGVSGVANNTASLHDNLQDMVNFRHKFRSSPEECQKQVRN